MKRTLSRLGSVVMALTFISSASGSSAELFPLDSVRLLDGPFKSAQDVDARYILAHDVDRLLAPFRREAKLPAKAEPYGNWESSGLDGHTAGHYLSALAMMSAATGDSEMKRRLDVMVDELAACQQANGDGYVGGMPGSKVLWADVAAGRLKVNGFGLNDRWVPWYNLHKLYAGLRDAYLIGRNERAREVLIGLADWCETLAGHLSDEQLQLMLRAEHGGMNEILADVYAITNDKKYLTLAERFTDRAILQPLIEGRDDLTGKHANTQIPKVIGFERIASFTNDADKHRAAEFFWNTVTEKRSVAIGGNSTNEHFHPTDNFGPMLEERTGPETCNTYNMLRLTEQLFTRSPHARYGDFYERALFNHILSSQHPTRGGFVYFTPMRPQHYRVYSQPEQAFWCCVGTGFENHARYGAYIYAHDHNDNLFVNLFVASELKWARRSAVVRQETAFPDEPKTTVTLSLQQSARFIVHLRQPTWLAGDMAVTVNGVAQQLVMKESGYVAIDREWRDGDRVEVQLPMRLDADRLPDGSDHVAFRCGPIVLAAKTGTDELLGQFAGDGRGDHITPGPMRALNDAPMVVTDATDQFTRGMRPVQGKPLTFTVPDHVLPANARTLELSPFFRLHEARYQIYWRVISPERYAAERERIKAEESERMALEAITVDRIAPGEQQSEVDHGFKGEQTSNGHFRERGWRDARGWFSYELRTPSREPAELRVTYFGGDTNRDFDILINDVPLARVVLKGEKPNAFVVERYPLPAAQNPEKPVTVKFVARPGSIAGGVFEIRVVRAGE